MGKFGGRIVGDNIKFSVFKTQQGLANGADCFVVASGDPVEQPPFLESAGCNLLCVAKNCAEILTLNSYLYDFRYEEESVVLFLPATLQLSMSQIQILADVLSADPLYAFTMPRISRFNDSYASEVKVAAMLPEHERRIYEGGCVLVRASVFGSFGLLGVAASSIDVALSDLLMKANRRGMSGRLVNSVLLPGSVGYSIQQNARLDAPSDYERALRVQSLTPEVKLDHLLSLCVSEKTHHDVLFDIRNLAPGFNGTAHHILSLLGPISRMAGESGIRPYFWATSEAAEFHGLLSQYSELVLTTPNIDRVFNACVRLSQPWSMTEVRDQAMLAPINIYSMLDTIAWDCHYIRAPHLDGVWRVMAEFSDAFIFNSKFTRDRFLSRFEAASRAEYKVAYCSKNPDEYMLDNCPVEAEGKLSKSGKYVLLVGNQYFHKGLLETVPVLSTAFPAVKFKVLGGSGPKLHNVEQIPSGSISGAEVAALFAGCSCLVFPSFYEGFGLPIFEALSFGKPVIARRSDLVEELYSDFKSTIELSMFSNVPELLRKLKVIVENDDEYSCRRKGAISPINPYGWADSARDILDLVVSKLESVDVDRCKKRLEFFYRMEMFDMEREGWSNQAQNMILFEVEKAE